MLEFGTMRRFDRPKVKTKAENQKLEGTGRFRIRLTEASK